MDNALQERVDTMLPFLNERQRRLFLASEAIAFGFGGVSEISRISGVFRMTITLGLKDLEGPELATLEDGHCRKSGGGRKSIKAHYPNIMKEIEVLLEPYTKGNPENPLQYTSKSTRNLKGERILHK
jgi:hypothetical protein